MKIQAKFRGKKEDIQIFIKEIESSSLGEAILTSDFINRDGDNCDLHLTFSVTEDHKAQKEIKDLTTIALIYACEFLEKILNRDFKEIMRSHFSMAKVFIESKSPQERLDFVTEKMGVLYEPPSN